MVPEYRKKLIQGKGLGQHNYVSTLGGQAGCQGQEESRGCGARQACLPGVSRMGYSGLQSLDHSSAQTFARTSEPGTACLL